MKKLLLLSFIFISAAGFSQSYTNSWIDYNKTYYKFYVGKDGVYQDSSISTERNIIRKYTRRAISIMEKRAGNTDYILQPQPDH